MVQVTDGKIKKGDLLVFSSAVLEKKVDYSFVCESAVAWEGFEIKTAIKFSHFITAWRKEGGCTCYFYKLNKGDGVFQCECIHCHRKSSWFNTKEAAKSDFFPFSILNKK